MTAKDDHSVQASAMYVTSIFDELLVFKFQTVGHQPFDTNCCHMGTARKHPILCQTGLSRRLQFLTSGHYDAQSFIHMATVGVEGFFLKFPMHQRD